MPTKESFKKRFDNALRVASVASIALAPYTPVFNQQEKAQSAKENGHARVLETPLSLNGISPLETPDGRRVVFSRETYEQQATEEERVVAEIRRIFELRDLAAVEKNIPPGSIAWMTTASRYLFLSREQAMGVFRTAFERRQPRCLAFRVFDEGQNKKISVLMKDFGVLEWDGELSAASSVSLTSHQGSWFISSVGEFPRSTLEEYVRRNSADLRPCPPRTTERQEQVQNQEVSVFGVQAGFNERGNLVLSAIDNKTREIALPPAGEFLYGKIKFSPDGTKIALWRRSLNPRFETGIYLVKLDDGNIFPLSPEFFDPGGEEINLVTWSSDSKKIAVGAGHHGGGKTVGIDIEAKQVLFEVPGSLFGRFSPDGNWFAKVVGRNTEIIGMDGKILEIPNAATFSWSPNNREIAMTFCTDWMETAWGDICQKGRIIIFDLATGRVRQEMAGIADAKEQPIFSPNGQKLLFKSDNPQGSGLRVYDLNSRKTQEIYIYPRIALIDDGWWKGFHESGLVLLYNQRIGSSFRYIFWVNPDNGEVISYQRAKIDRERIGDYIFIKEVSASRVLYGVTRAGTSRVELYWAPINLKVFDYVLEGVRAGSYIPQRGRDIIEIFAVLKNGDRFLSGGRQFLFRNGNKHLIEHTETAEYFGSQTESLLEVLTAFIPEGEKISFRPGDAVGDKENKKFGIWYLRNGKRYWIQNWEWFLRGQRLPPETKPTQVGKAILERIPEGEVPEARRGESGWFDWDDTLKEFQPYGGRMVLSMGGYKSTKKSQYETFATLRSVVGLAETQHLYPTYNAFRRDGALFLEDHDKEHTKVHPLESVKKASEQIRRYKEILPMTKFILVGHSLGGFVLFNAAVEHADAVEAVITLDSPLAGVDKSFLAALADAPAELADMIVSFRGSEVGKYLVEKGDDPKFKEEVEAKAEYMISRGVKVITATNQDDIFIPEWVSVLDASKKQANELGIQLIWELGHLPPLPEFLSLGGWGEFVTGHSQIYEDEGVLRTLIQPLSLP